MATYVEETLCSLETREQTWHNFTFCLSTQIEHSPDESPFRAEERYDVCVYFEVCLISKQIFHINIFIILNKSMI